MSTSPQSSSRPTGGQQPTVRASSASVVLYDAGSQSREVLTFGFEREDFEVFGTDDPEEAVRLVKVAGAPILVVSLGTDPAARAGAISFIDSLRGGNDHSGLAVVALGRRDMREDVLRAGADEFVSWPAFIRDAVTLARLALAARAEQGAGLSGLLEDYEVYFMVRALAAASRSAVIELDRGGRKAFVHLARGEVVAAKVGRLSGIAAFHHLLLWGEASLRLRFSSPPGERKIDAPVEDLLQSGVKFVAEFERLAERVGGPQAMFEKKPARVNDASVKIPAEVRRFADAVVTGATLVDLVENSPFKPFDTIKVCYRLCELGLIARRDPVRSISPLTAQLAVRDWLLGTAASSQRSTVTEAGRRAAEAYAEAAAERARTEPMPSEELFAPPSAHIGAVPTPTIEDAPTAPRESVRGPVARNKSKGERVTSPNAREATKPASVARAPAPVTSAPAHEQVFDDVDEAFFAKEAEIGQVQPAESFEDLDDTGRKRRLAQKKKWSLFGDKPAAPKPAGKKKR